MDIGTLMILLPFLTAPLLAYMYNKTFGSSNIKNKIKSKKIKINKIDIINNNIIISEKTGFYGIRFLELDTKVLNDYENEYELISKLSKIGKILSNVDSEIEYRIIKHNINPEKIASKIKDEIDKLTLIKQSNEIIISNIEEREKELKKIYDYILNGEKIV